MKRIKWLLQKNNCIWNALTFSEILVENEKMITSEKGFSKMKSFEVEEKLYDI